MELYGLAQFIIVIEVNGVQFGLKSYPSFEITTKIAQHGVQLQLYYIRLWSAKCNQYSTDPVLSWFVNDSMLPFILLRFDWLL